jgi:hypothetical protein
MKEHALPACKLDSPDDLRFRVLTAEDAATILSWQYAPPYDFYNHAGPSREAVADLLRPEYGYHAIQCAQGRMIGYFCVGADARVPGSKYDNSALDLGMGLDRKRSRQDVRGRNPRSSQDAPHQPTGASYGSRLEPACAPTWPSGWLR